MAKVLNLEGSPFPTLSSYRDGRPVAPSWKAGTVRSVLMRELYRGIHVWNRSRKRNSTWWHVDQHPRDAGEWKRTPWEHCRIVDDALWNRVQERHRAIQERTIRFGRGHLGGRPPRREVRNLLAGLARCGECGSGLVVETAGRGDHRLAAYTCRRYRHSPTRAELERYVVEPARATAIFCANALRIATEVMHEAVLQAVEEHVLIPEAVELVVQLSERDNHTDRREQLERAAERYRTTAEGGLAGDRGGR